MSLKFNTGECETIFKPKFMIQNFTVFDPKNNLNRISCQPHLEHKKSILWSKLKNNIKPNNIFIDLASTVESR